MFTEVKVKSLISSSLMNKHIRLNSFGTYNNWIRQCHIHSPCGTVDWDTGGAHIHLSILWNVQFHSLHWVNDLKLRCLDDRHRETIYYGFMHKCMIDRFFKASLEKLNYFVKHYCENLCSLIGRQTTVKISWQNIFWVLSLQMCPQF